MKNFLKILLPLLTLFFCSTGLSEVRKKNVLDCESIYGSSNPVTFRVIVARNYKTAHVTLQRPNQPVEKYKAKAYVTLGLMEPCNIGDDFCTGPIFVADHIELDFADGKSVIANFRVGGSGYGKLYEDQQAPINLGCVKNF